MQQLIFTIHILVSIALVILVVSQHGKGAEAGAAFGGGASQTIFGSKGSVNFITKLIASLALTLFVTSLSLNFFAGERAKLSLLKELETTQAETKNITKPDTIPE